MATPTRQRPPLGACWLLPGEQPGGVRWSPRTLALTAAAVLLATAAVKLLVAAAARIQPTPVDVASAVPALVHADFSVHARDIGSNDVAAYAAGALPFTHHARESRITVATFATRDTPQLQRLLALLVRAGYSYTVLGLGQKFTGWEVRMRAYRGAAEAVSAAAGPHRWLLFVDAYDTVPLRPAKELAALLDGENGALPPGTVLTGADEECWSNCQPLGHAWWLARQADSARHRGLTAAPSGSARPASFWDWADAERWSPGLESAANRGSHADDGAGLPRYRFVDGGTLLGRAADVAALYAWDEAHFPEDDQLATARYFVEHPAAGAVDARRVVFANVALGRLPEAPAAGVQLLSGVAVERGVADDAAGGADWAPRPFWAHFPFQAGEDGVSSTLREAATLVAGVRDARARMAAATALVQAWPAIKARLQSEHAAAAARQSALMTAGVVSAVLAAALALLAVESGWRLATTAMHAAARTWPPLAAALRRGLAVTAAAKEAPRSLPEAPTLGRPQHRWASVPTSDPHQQQQQDDEEG